MNISNAAFFPFQVKNGIMTGIQGMTPNNTGMQQSAGVPQNSMQGPNFSNLWPMSNVRSMPPVGFNSPQGRSLVNTQARTAGNITGGSSGNLIADGYKQLLQGFRGVNGNQSNFVPNRQNQNLIMQGYNQLLQGYQGGVGSLQGRRMPQNGYRPQMQNTPQPLPQNQIVDGYQDMLQAMSGNQSNPTNQVTNQTNMTDPKKIQTDEMNQSDPNNSAQALMNSINGDALGTQAYNGLMPEMQQQLMAMAPNFTQTSELTNDAVNLLKSGKLMNVDSQGHSLLQNLYGLSQQKFGEGIDGNEIFSNTVQELANPGLINQGNKATCTAATLQYMQAINNPAEYTKIVAGLTGEQGQVQGPQGELFARNNTATAYDYSDRNAVDRIYQAAMMDYGNGDHVYDNDTDLSFDPNNQDQTSHTGLRPYEYEFLANGVLPYDSQILQYDASNQADSAQLQQKINGSLNKGVNVPLVMNWSSDPGTHSNHSVLLTGMDNNYAYMRNPWGAGDDLNSGPARTQTDDYGSFQMKLNDFYQSLKYAIIPNGMA